MRQGAPLNTVPGPPVPLLDPPWSVRMALGEGDLALIHGWMHQPHVAEFWQQDWSHARWRAEIDRQRRGAHSVPCLVALDGVDIAYIEVYRLARDMLAEHLCHDSHDLGVHIAIGAPERTGRGFGTRLLAALARGLFDADPACGRILAEPDRRNGASIAAFGAAGFVPSGELTLPDKIAMVMIRTRC